MLSARSSKQVPAARTMGPSSKSKSTRDCLCLICRQAGHVVGKCPWFLWQERNPDTLKSPPPPDIECMRQSPPFIPRLSVADDSTEAMCQRCADMKEWARIERHSPWVKSDENVKSHVAKKMDQMASLGPIRSLRLLSTCPLCRLVFNITYLTDEDISSAKPGGKLILVTAWMPHRLEPDLEWTGYERGRGPYAKCVYTSATLWPQKGRQHPLTKVVEDSVDAVALIDAGKSRKIDTAVLGARKVDLKSPDYDAIKRWLDRCDSLHSITCQPQVSDGLKQIKLVDVETRQIVMYPLEGCEYLALSYVWGPVEQPSYQFGDILRTIPATLEDALTVTRNLGKRYLWADSLCIDQGNEEEKAIQITLMSAIYSGAWATITCLSGLSADSGLPRVGLGTLQGVIPQLRCELWGKQLLSVMPTLSQQISWSRWATRAWTFLEGKLSPRRLFFTNHQVYFECNSFQCCESLDDSNSPFHLSSNKEQRVALDAAGDPEVVIGKGVLRDPFRPLSTPGGTHLYTNDMRYLNLVSTYTTRKMTHDTDSLNAFSAVLTRLQETCYRSGFVCGLPVEDLPRALSWCHASPSRRRFNFPMWSWAGWEGDVEDEFIHGGYDFDKPFMPPLRIWKAGNDGHAELIYDANPANQSAKQHNPGDDKTEDSKKDASSDTSDEDPEDEISSDYSDDSDGSGDASDAWYATESEETGLNPPEDDSDSESSPGHGEGSDDDRPMQSTRDPVFNLAKAMLVDIPPVPQKIDRNELVIEGIVLRLTFMRDEGWYSLWRDDKKGFVVTGKDGPRLSLDFKGHNASRLITTRQWKEQEFLLLSREHTYKEALNNVVLLIDRDGEDGEIAYRAGVACLSLDGVRDFERFKTERKLLRFR